MYAPALTRPSSDKTDARTQPIGIEGQKSYIGW